jgi:predicted transcriptional regulator
MTRRSKLEVFVDILKVVAQEGEIRRTRVMFKANLAWNVLKDSLESMEKSGTIKTERKSSGVFISLTQEGHNLLHRFSEFETALSPQAGAGTASLLATSMLQA